MSRKKLRAVTEKSKSFGLEIKKCQICFAMTGSIGLILDSKLAIAKHNINCNTWTKEKCSQIFFRVKIDFRKIGTNRKKTQLLESKTFIAIPYGTKNSRIRKLKYSR